MVLLIDPTGQQVGRFTVEKAQHIADHEYGLDLVQVSDGVFKILDVGKKQYEERKKKQPKPKPMKEIKLKLNIAPGDFETKIKAIKKFLSAGNNVRVTVWFTGREISRPEAGTLLLKRVEEAVIDFGIMDDNPSLLGKNLHATLQPRGR